MRNACKKRTGFVLLIIFFIALLQFDFGPHQSYTVIGNNDIVQYLYEEVGKNLTVNSFNICEYQDIILSDKTSLPLSIINGDLTTGHGIKHGGEFLPLECKPKFSVAIIVPYKDKAEQLRSFLIYMHTFLKKQKIHYRIYVVEQLDNLAFNSAKLENVGVLAAIKAGFPCVILHSMNLLPLILNNLYVCTESPRLMSASIKKYRFLPSFNTNSGVISLKAEQYKLINGLSNEYYGWDSQDNLLYRLGTHGLSMCQFGNDISQYYVLGEDDFDGVKKKPEYFSKESIAADGLNSLHYKEHTVTLHPLFTHIAIELEDRGPYS